MAYYFVQQYWVLPNIGEALETPTSAGVPSSSQSLEASTFGRQNLSGRRPGQGSPGFPNSLAYPYTYINRFPLSTNQTYQMDDSYNAQAYGQSRGAPRQVPDDGEGGFAMGNLGAALPTYRASPQSYGLATNTQRFPSLPSTPLQQHQQQLQQQQAFHLGNQVIQPGAGQHPDFSSPYTIPYGSAQAGSPRSQSFQQLPAYRRPLNPSPQPNLFPNQQLYYPHPYSQIDPAQQGFQGQQRVQEVVVNPFRPPFPQNIGSTGQVSPRSPGFAGFQGAVPRGRAIATPSSGSIPSAPRGPPRKPKQSGHALWVGNLPPGALVNDLKDHFSRDAMRDIESVFLISKSNCAFVNYKTEEACAAAMARFHDSTFHGVRLVCRLRRTPAAVSPGVPTGPAALSPTIPTYQVTVEAEAKADEESAQADQPAGDKEGATKAKDKYFIVKSLTVEDLELSARNGIWATQAHNEEALNKAYSSVENVYLVFSANKSGEYFGYARMASSIDDDSASKLEWAPRTGEVIDESDLPCSIPTPATETAPKGRIIDDSARGTIFWEAESDGSERSVSPIAEGPSDPLDPSADIETPRKEHEFEDQPTQPTGTVQAFGKPFKIEWKSTNRLPFYRTRGLRNSWNSNREVKIARDGTELETSVGRRLIQMFDRQNPLPQQLPISPGFQGPIGGPMMGYSNARPF